MNSLLIQFAYLQLLDALTTMAFLFRGVEEANPLVQRLIDSFSPAGGLLLIKIAALLLGFYCWRLGKTHLLTRINVAFALLIAWNIVALILAPGGAVS